MRCLVKATIPVEAGNALVRDPQFGKRFEAIMQDIKPEAAYFSISHGQRGMYLIVNVNDTAQFARVVEPLWLAFNCDVEITPVVTADDMGSAMGVVQELIKKY